MIKPVMFGKFCLLERISVGGMAEVFRAKCLDTPGFDKFLAIKRILPNLAEDDEFIQMFIDEAKITVQLNHRNICQIYELGRLEDSHYIVMEFISGRDILAILNRLRRERRIMSVGQAAYMVHQMALGLDSAHRKTDKEGSPLNIIHRDVSPQNVLVSYTGEVKIIDFGIAKAASRSNKTQAGVLKGKFGYMSPEQVRGLDIDHRSDIFALGTLFHEMLTCRRLFHGGSDFATLEKVRRAEVLPPSKFNPNVPPEIDAIVLKALAADVKDRYQWGSELADDITGFLSRLRPPYTGRTLEDWMQRTFTENLQEEVRKRQIFAQFNTIEDLERHNAQLRAEASQPVEHDDHSLLTGDRAMVSGGAGEEDELADEATHIWDGSGPLPGADDAIAEMKTQIASDVLGPGGLLDEGMKAEATRIMTDYDPNAPDPLLPPPPSAHASSPFATAPGGEFQAPVTGVTQLPEQGPSTFNLILIAGLLCLSVVIVAGLAWLLLFSGEGSAPPPTPAAPQVTSIVVRTDPVQQVEVLLNGELKATRTPFEMRDLQAGVYEVEIRHGEFNTVKRSVVVSEGEQKELDLTLERKPEGKGLLTLNVTPDGAHVFVDGEPLTAKEGGYQVELSDRTEHLIEATLPGHLPEEVRLRVSDGQRVTKSLALKPVKARLDLKCKPRGLVFLDGDRVGMSPQSFAELKPYTTYALEIRLAGYAPWQRTLVFHRSLTKTLSATLQRTSDGEASADRFGHLAIQSPTTWWRVSIDGWGGGGLTAPIPAEQKLTLPAGKHTITFQRGDQTHTRDVEIRPDETATIEITDDFQW